MVNELAGLEVRGLAIKNVLGMGMPSADFDTKNPQATVADARAEGFTHIFPRCSQYEESACLPFNLIRRLPRSATLRDITVCLPCYQCGSPAAPGSVVYWQVGDGTRGL